MRTESVGATDLGRWGSRSVVARATATRAARSGVLWGALFGLLVWNEAATYFDSLPTARDRAQIAETFGANAGIAAVIGPARDLDTVGGFVAWRTFGLVFLLAALWGLLTATRLMRKEEDAGRWELYLAGRTNRRHATGQAVAGLAVGWVVLWATTAALTLAAGTLDDVDFTVSASLFFATAATASAAMFLAVGALTSQLGATRRQANGLAAAAFTLAFLVRMVADAGTGLAWLRWASPLGWVENLEPFTGSRPVALGPIVVLIVVATGAAVVVAGRRDLGAGTLTTARSTTPEHRPLRGPMSLVVRLERWVALAWVLGVGLLALLFGVVAAVAAEADIDDTTVAETVQRLGGQGAGATAWIGYEMLFIASLITFAAASQLTATRSEEADGHLDHLLARRVGRPSWLAGRLGFGGALMIGCGLAAGIGAWIGVVTGTDEIGVVEMLAAGVNITAPALLVVGVGALLFGLLPRLAVPLLYVFVVWSFIIGVVGSSITSNRWLLDTAMFTHLTPVPAGTINWTPVLAMVGLGLAAGLGGLAAFTRRDLAPA